MADLHPFAKHKNEHDHILHIDPYSDRHSISAWRQPSFIENDTLILNWNGDYNVVASR